MKHALLIGINRYPNLPSNQQLRGCLNDVTLMDHILRETFGFSRNQISLLCDEYATRDGILEAMDHLIERVQRDDIVVLFYSGHGSQMTDREGDESDGLDETIVPSDSGREPHPNRDISDDEIYLWLLRLGEKTANITLIFDCCHSGTISRDLFGGRVRWIEPDLRSIESLPASPVSGVVMRSSRRAAGPSGWLPLSHRYVLIAACEDRELAYEVNVGNQHAPLIYGALTYCLCQELIRTTSGTTYRDVSEQVRTRIAAMLPRQHTQIEGSLDREVFGIHDIEPMRFVGVGPRTDGAVNLMAGGAHGVTVGSRWAIYPPATKQITAATQQLGIVEINSVQTITSTAYIVDESEPDAIVEHCRAVEKVHSYGDTRLKIELTPAAGFEYAGQALMEAIADSPLVKQAERGEMPDVRAYVLAPRTAIDAHSPVPQLGSVSEPTWAIVGADGRLAMPAHKLHGLDVVLTLCENLEKLVRYQRMLLLHNPDDYELHHALECVLLRQAVDGTWVVARPEDTSGQITYVEGERLAIQITNHHHAPLYVTVFDLGLTGSVTALFPPAGPSERIDPGRLAQIGVRQGEELTLYMPANFPYAPEPANTTPVGGYETLKLLVTTKQTDFSLLIQPGMKVITLSPLEHVVQMTLNGSRDVHLNRLPTSQDWTTVTRSFFLRRR